MNKRHERGATRCNTQQELEAPAYGRRWRNERQRDKQPNKKRHERGAMRVGGAIRGGEAGSREAAL